MLPEINRLPSAQQQPKQRPVPLSSAMARPAVTSALVAAMVVQGHAVAPSPDPCHMALAFSCGAALSSCTNYPCAACEACVLGNQTALGKAGCTPAEEVAYCAAPPPLACTYTDSRGDTYDLTGIPKVDGKFTKINAEGESGDAATLSIKLVWKCLGAF